MEIVIFENEYFKTIKDGESFKTCILKDLNKFYDIDLTGSVLSVNQYGIIQNKFTDKAIKGINYYCKEIDTTKHVEDLKIELRNRTMNTLMGMII